MDQRYQMAASALRSRINQNTNLIFSKNENDCVQFEILKGRFCRMVLNKPKTMNQLEEDIIQSVREVVALAQENNCTFILFEGNGRAFCSGEDLNKKVKLIKQNRKDEFYRICKNELLFYYEMSQITLPLVTIWDGVVMGGGITISVYGKYRIATENTVLSLPECQLGYFPCGAAMQFLSHLPNPQLGIYLGMTGVRLKGYDTLLAGLATHYIESKNLPYIRIKMMEAKSDNEVHQILKNSSTYISNGRLQDIDEIITHFSENNLKAIYQQLQRRLLISDFCKDTINKLNKLSPFSIQVWLKLFQLGQSKTRIDLQDVFKLEFFLMQKIIDQTDYLEVINSVFITETNPIYKFKSIYHVSDIEVFEFINKHAPDLQPLF